MTYRMKKGDPVLIAELSRGSSQKDAANLADVGLTTVARRLADPEFRQLVSKQRRLFLDCAAGLLAKSSAGAAQVLDSLAQDKDEAGHVRRSAARDILDHSMKIRESMELEERMQAIEDQMRNLDG